SANCTVADTAPAPAMGTTSGGDSGEPASSGSVYHGVVSEPAEPPLPHTGAVSVPQGTGGGTSSGYPALGSNPCAITPAVPGAGVRTRVRRSGATSSQSSMPQLWEKPATVALTTLYVPDRDVTAG